MAIRLTKLVVDSTGPAKEPGKRLFLWDSALPGFGLLVMPSGVKTFIFQYRTAEGSTRRLAEYGSIYGQHADIGPDKKRYFWTKRGLCRASPFENLTESDVSVPPGVTACGGVIHQHGYTKFVVALKSGGAAYNKR